MRGHAAETPETRETLDLPNLEGARGSPPACATLRSPSCRPAAAVAARCGCAPLTHTLTHTHALTHTHTEVQTQTPTQRHRNAHTLIHTLSHTHTEVQMQTPTQRHRSTHTHAHTRTHIHTLTHRRVYSLCGWVEEVAQGGNKEARHRALFDRFDREHRGFLDYDEFMAVRQQTRRSQGSPTHSPAHPPTHTHIHTRTHTLPVCHSISMTLALQRWRKSSGTAASWRSTRAATGALLLTSSLGTRPRSLPS
jgi:hypothetical protein